jgi:glycosyltransferase involved in cell wall biosynthesis
MKLAFYAPLKQPNHTVASGDRTMARALIQALEMAGADVMLASALRTRDGTGDAALQQKLIAQADTEAQDLIRRGRAEGWRVWVTYHNYYKAPDLLGPEVSYALNIPYIQIESTRARKRLDGPWDTFARKAEAAADAADLIFYLTTRDAIALKRDAPANQILRHLKPFLRRHILPIQTSRKDTILSVGMMRDGDKEASYALIAETLTLIKSANWHLNIAGDGPARDKIERMFAAFGEQVTFLGALEAAALETVYQNAGILFWPGVNEAFGLTYLEAQAYGVPVLAQNRPGVCDVLAPGYYPDPDIGARGLAQQLAALLGSAAKRRTLGFQARDYIAEGHLIPRAAETLRSGLADLGVSI